MFMSVPTMLADRRVFFWLIISVCLSNVFSLTFLPNKMNKLDDYDPYMALNMVRAARHLPAKLDNIEDNYIKSYEWESAPSFSERFLKRHFAPNRRINRAAPSIRSRGAYNKRRLELSLCHFKICNMKLSSGRKRAARFASHGHDLTDYIYD